jgi:endonuclease G, mitochondrial
MSEHHIFFASCEMTAALTSLRDSRCHINADPNAYYDERKDKKNQITYYASLSKVMTPKERFHALHALLEATHTTQPPYRPSVELYPWIDLHPDQTLHSIYSDQSMDPEEAIRGDFEMLHQIQQVFSSLLPEELRLPPEEFSDRLESIVATFPFNCEHAVPQGWFTKREPMRGDLHHLFACEPACNAFRGSLPFFDFSLDEGVRERCGRKDRGGFEPASGKGVVARAVLYFFLRYPGEIKPREHQKKQLKTLLSWHHNFSVSLYERHRNATIEERQGNRNPLIDYPEWADKIDFFVGA